MKKYLTENRKQTFKLGKDFAARISPGDILLLYGELGAGKTTFVQGLAKGLGIKDRIISPTFVLIRQYEIPNYSSSDPPAGGESRNSRPFGLAQGGQARTINLYHIDLYRIEKPDDLTNLGLSEIAEDQTSITVIEWADRIKGIDLKQSLPAGRQGYKIFFKHLSKNKREISVEN